MGLAQVDITSGLLHGRNLVNHQSQQTTGFIDLRAHHRVVADEQNTHTGHRLGAVVKRRISACIHFNRSQAFKLLDGACELQCQYGIAGRGTFALQRHAHGLRGQCQKMPRKRVLMRRAGRLPRQATCLDGQQSVFGPVFDAERHHHPFALAAAPLQRGVEQTGQQAWVDDDLDRLDIAKHFDAVSLQQGAQLCQ